MPSRPLQPPDEIMDAVGVRPGMIMVYVLHCLDRPLEFMENVKKYMGPDTPLVIIEKDSQRERAHPPSFMTRREVLATIQETGYELIRTETFLPRDTIYVLKLRP